MKVRNKGRNFIINLESQWIDETGSRPTDNEIVDHIMNMDNEEFDSYVEGKKYTMRDELREEVSESFDKLKSENQRLREQLNSKLG